MRFFYGRAPAGSWMFDNAMANSLRRKRQTYMQIARETGNISFREPLSFRLRRLSDMKRRGDKVNIDSKKLQESLDYIKKVNGVDLNEIEIDGVKLIDIVGKDAIDDWRFVGLSNCSFFEFNDSVSASLNTTKNPIPLAALATVIKM